MKNLILLSNVAWIHDLTALRTVKVKVGSLVGKERVKMSPDALSRRSSLRNDFWRQKLSRSEKPTIAPSVGTHIRLGLLLVQA